MADNVKFFKDNVDYYSKEYKDYSLKPWEKKIRDMVSGPNVLDVACGGGRMTIPLLRMGHNVTGTDFVAEFENKIREHDHDFMDYLFKFVESGMTELPFPDNVFDSVTCINSLVYLRDIKEVRASLREMRRVLKLGGKLFITTWNILHPYWAASVILNFLLRRGKRFGETSPFWKSDRRIKNSQIRMFVPTKRILEQVLREAHICDIHICTGPQYVGSRLPLTQFHYNITVTGRKEQDGK